MEPLHFSVSGRTLFGLRFEPNVAPRRTAILLCPSWGIEYMRTYRGVSLLARALADKGFETMRFDYSCTGDSSGRTGEARLPMWIEDVARAGRELLDVAGAQRLCVVGLRLGALLASRAVQQGMRADHTVLWDAPESGGDWISQLRALEGPYYGGKNRFRSLRNQLEPHPEELMGMPIDPALTSELAGLVRAAPAAAAQGLQIRSKDETIAPLADLPQLVIPDESHWLEPAWINTPWTPSPSIHQVAAHFAGWLS